MSTRQGVQTSAASAVVFSKVELDDLGFRVSQDCPKVVAVGLGPPPYQSLGDLENLKCVCVCVCACARAPLSLSGVSSSFGRRGVLKI